MALEDRPLTALDAAFVVGLTLLLARGLARAVGLPAGIGTAVTAGAVVATTSGLGGEGVQAAARSILAPANHARNALIVLPLPSGLLGTPEVLTDAAA